MIPDPRAEERTVPRTEKRRTVDVAGRIHVEHVLAQRRLPLQQQPVLGAVPGV